MHTKQFYEAPEAELLVVRFEEGFLFDSQLNTRNSSNQTEYYSVDPDDYDEL